MANLEVGRPGLAGRGCQPRLVDRGCTCLGQPAGVCGLVGRPGVALPRAVWPRAGWLGPAGRRLVGEGMRSWACRPVVGQPGGRSQACWPAVGRLWVGSAVGWPAGSGIVGWPDVWWVGWWLCGTRPARSWPAWGYLPSDRPLGGLAGRVRLVAGRPAGGPAYRGSAGPGWPTGSGAA